MGKFGTQDNVQDEYARLQERLRDVVQEIGDLNMVIRTSGSCGEHIKRLYNAREMKAELNRKMEALESIMEREDG